MFTRTTHFREFIDEMEGNINPDITDSIINEITQHLTIKANDKIDDIICKLVIVLHLFSFQTPNFIE